MEVKEKLKETKLKFLEKLNKKLEDEDLTTEDMKNISSALSSITDYTELLYGFSSLGAQQGEKTDKNTN